MQALKCIHSTARTTRVPTSLTLEETWNKELGDEKLIVNSCNHMEENPSRLALMMEP